MFMTRPPLVWMHLTWQRRRRQRRWWSARSWSQPACETASLCAMWNWCVKESSCCSGSEPPRSDLLWSPRRSSGRSDERRRERLKTWTPPVALHSMSSVCGCSTWQNKEDSHRHTHTYTHTHTLQHATVVSNTPFGSYWRIMSIHLYILMDVWLQN